MEDFCLVSPWWIAKTVNSVPKVSSIYHNTTGSDSLQLSIFAELDVKVQFTLLSEMTLKTIQLF